MELRHTHVTINADKDQKQAIVQTRLANTVEDWVSPGTSKCVTLPKSLSMTCDLPSESSECIGSYVVGWHL